MRRYKVFYHKDGTRLTEDVWAESKHGAVVAFVGCTGIAPDLVTEVG